MGSRKIQGWQSSNIKQSENGPQKISLDHPNAEQNAPRPCRHLRKPGCRRRKGMRPNATPPSPKAVDPGVLRWSSHGDSNQWKPTAMSLSKQIAAFLLCLFCWSSALAAPSVCPIRQGQPLRHIDVFDGEPADLASLEPDVAKERYGHWVLGYIYDDGRFVTIRCKYANEQTHDARLTERVEQCSYSISKNNDLRVACK